jgi:hypothetical protein
MGWEKGIFHVFFCSMEKKQYFWMNLIMTSRRDFNGIIPFYGLVISGIFSLVNQYNPARLFYE